MSPYKPFIMVGEEHVDSECGCCGLGFSHFSLYPSESDGCHTKDKPEEGMNPEQITQLLHANLADHAQKQRCRLEFVGFPTDDPTHGWYSHATGAETRAQAETRAAKFYLWLCHALDVALSTAPTASDIFDAGVRIAGEEEEVDFDYFAPRLRRRRTYLLVGHGDFMSLVLKRIMAGYGYAIEHEGIPHRSAMVHVSVRMNAWMSFLFLDHAILTGNLLFIFLFAAQYRNDGIGILWSGTIFVNATQCNTTLG